MQHWFWQSIAWIASGTGLFAGTAAVIAPQEIVQPVPGSGTAAAPVPYDPIATTIDGWRRLQQSDNLSFSEYANFMLAHPGWPGERSRRAAAETSLSGIGDPALADRFFTRFPPLTGAGHARHAEALAALGRTAEASAAAQRAWRAGSLRPQDEMLILTRFGAALTPADHDARMDRLLWQNATSTAQRQLGYTSPAMRSMFAARLSYRTNAADAALLPPDLGRSDPGLIADRASWLRNNNQSIAARALLAQPRQLTTLPADAEKWFEVLLTNARAAAADGQHLVAWQIASQVDDAYPAGTDVSVKSLGERDDYTSLVWLAGTTAMDRLARPADAVGMFSRYGNGSRTPQTRSKGYYWAGRAAEAAGDRAGAQQWYARAGGYPDLYYGQLALERLGQSYRAPGQSQIMVGDDARRTFMNREVVRAARYLGATGQRKEQTLFVRQIANDATSDTDHALAAELAGTLGRPDLGVMVGRSALLNGLSDYTAAGYPSIAVPMGQDQHWTMIHAIARQESQFDREAISHAGARGMMQLMPGTAREQAGKLGLSYDASALTRDIGYNIQLGSGYFQRMLDYYGGSYPLAVAAYNAGPGNVNKWLAANGDPRTGSVDMVRWVEAIPIFETKNYVQRVLENAVVYDLMHPQRARSRGPHHMSWYLGKGQPG
ncbi:lytic transglycosylase domain-containing protein [Sphingomonas sp. BGYR3]|uniref:lytic transglycosylase domain-containing protein n=1 Tax=Sphingomonas sp. BGYR3 TaxID=2975483 RepID=UPI0021A932F8|nr:lytic transglycosylase domain-containing protein [Sphingomonas sp. BGYR3]MDG5487642.1 lytic transglycosylase domain-containing protein [Sphingomonas sp. BGYR3]